MKKLAIIGGIAAVIAVIVNEIRRNRRLSDGW